MLTLEKLDARIPKWDLDSLADRPCPYCSTKNMPRFQRPDLLPVSFCDFCGCWYISKLPPINAITSLYEGYFHSHRPTDLSKIGAMHLTNETSKTGQSNWQLQALMKAHTGNRPMRILDVGCGYGRFLLEARSIGAEVIGCDLSPEACVFMNNILSIPVYHAELHACQSTIGKVDAVVMRDFIEHPVHPMLDIQAAVNVLNPGGLLLLHTPNGGEAGTSTDTARAWVGFRVDLEHLQYLSPRTINYISDKYKLQIETLTTSGFPYLKGIDLSPQQKSASNVAHLLKKSLKQFPGVHRIKKSVQQLFSAFKDPPSDPRLGSYHLFAILRNS